MKRQSESKLTIEWYCLKCWQEGSCEIESAPAGWAGNVADLPAVQLQHAQIISRIQGGRGCVGNIHKQERMTHTKVRREAAPMLPDVGEPLIIGRQLSKAADAKG